MAHVRGLHRVVLRVGLVSVLMAAALWVPTASAYDAKTHEAVGLHVLGSDAWLLTPATIPGASAGELKQFRAWLYEQITGLGDANLVGRFRKRFPSVEAFDSQALRTFLGLTQRPRARLWSLDRSRGGKELDARGIFAASVSAPLRDGRTRDRYLYEAATGQVRRDRFGRAIPDDPATLDDGAQGRGAVDMVGVHADLAQLALLWSGRASRYLAVSFAGQAFSYLLTAADPTLASTGGQFSDDAGARFWWRAFVTSGGYLAELRSEATLERNIVENHRQLADALFDRQAAAALSGEPTNPETATAFETIPTAEEPTIAQAIAAAAPIDAPMVAASAVQAQAEARGKALYEALTQAVCGRLSGYGFRLPAPRPERPVDYDTFLCTQNNDGVKALESAYALQAAGITSASAAMRALDAAMGRAAEDQDGTLRAVVLERLTRGRLDALDAVEQRRERWMSAGAETLEVVQRPVWPAVQATAAFLIIALVVWRLNKRLPMPRYLPAEAAVADEAVADQAVADEAVADQAVADGVAADELSPEAADDEGASDDDEGDPPPR